MPRLHEDRRLAARTVAAEELPALASELAARFPEVEAVWLFGSYAHGRNRPTSDVDLAIHTSRARAGDLAHRYDLQEAAEQRLGVPVDVVLLGPEQPLPLLWEILRKPVLLFARDPADAAALASTLRSMIRDEWPRLERRWQRTREWAKE